MKLETLVLTSAQVTATSARNAKRDALAACLAIFDAGEIKTGTSYLTGVLPQGRIGIGPAVLRECARVPPSSTTKLGIMEVHGLLERVNATRGAGSAGRRREILTTLFTRATLTERDFLLRLLAGELRQGALDGVMVEAIGAAFQLPSSSVRRAYMLRGDIALVASVASKDGLPGLDQIRLAPGTPVRSMLAQPAEGIADVFSNMPDALFDVKMDGARVQVHKQGSDVAVFSRRLNDVSASVPEVVELVRALAPHTLVLDGEVIAMDDTGCPLPFQATMRRFGRTSDVAHMREMLPLSVFFFDCLHGDGDDFLDFPLMERLALLDNWVPPERRMPRLHTSRIEEATEFLARTFEAGHEGLMGKSPDSAYAAGNRGRSWLKVKQAHTLDLVVLGAEWGSGRRRGTLSNLHLGAWDEATGVYVMLGKTFKGMTDEMLAWQTTALQEIEVSRDSHTVYVEPQLVVEIAFNDVQLSPQYPAGIGLRFARVKQYRKDKSAKDADTLAAVRALLPAGGHTPLSNQQV